MRLPEIGSSSSTQPTNPPPADTSSSSAKAFETAMYAAKSATSSGAPANSQVPGHGDPPLPYPGPGWAQPTDWNAHSLPGSSHPGKDPFNIIISGNSNVTLQQLEQGLEQVPNPSGAPMIQSGPDFKGLGQFNKKPAQWAPVPNSNSLWNPGTGPENANVQPHGQGQEVQQQLSMRLGGTQTEFNANINHFRVYQQQQLPGDRQDAYFIAASQESFNPHWGFNGSFPWIASPYHDVASPNGFNQGRDNLLNDIKTAAKMQGWNVEVYSVPAESPGTGSNGVGYDGVTDVVTLTHASG